MSNKDDLMALVALIQNPEIRQFTEQMIQITPAENWARRASKNHHPVDERGDEGNMIHSVRVIKICRLMAEARRMKILAVDILTSAASIHDTGRYGLDGKSEFTIPDHPYLVRDLANIHNISCPYDTEIFALVEKHMGIWGKKEFVPAATDATLLHFADMVSANADKIWGGAKLDDPSWNPEVPFVEQGMSEDMMVVMGELAEDNEYWTSANRFVKQVSNRKFSSLTEGQQSWIEKIISSLEEEIDKRME